MLKEQGIGRGGAGEEVAARAAVAAVVGEEGRREVLQWLKPQIDEGGCSLG